MADTVLDAEVLGKYAQEDDNWAERAIIDSNSRVDIASQEYLDRIRRILAAVRAAVLSEERERLANFTLGQLRAERARTLAGVRRVVEGCTAQKNAKKGNKLAQYRMKQTVLDAIRALQDKVTDTHTSWSQDIASEGAK